MDEFEIEITPLDGPNDGDAPEWVWSGDTAARSPFAPHLSRRGKIARMTTACSAVLLACALIVAVSPALRGALKTLVRGSVPTGYAATPPGSEDVYFENSVPWGTLLLDGHAALHPTNPTVDHLMVAPGQHTLVYEDPPFAPLRCHFQVPLRAQDNCPLEFTPPESPPDAGLYVRIINLGATPDRLPANQLVALTRTVNVALGALSSTTYVPAGTMYLSASGTPVAATRPLLATLVFRLNTDPRIVAPYLPGGHLCSQICYLGDGVGDAQSWGLLALTRISWSYTWLNGHVIAQDLPASPAPDGSTALITIGTTWTDGAWHAVAFPHRDQFGVSPVCDVASTLVPPTPVPGVTPMDYAQEQIPALTSADGCVITMRLNHVETPGVGATAYLLYRFGVLVAANDEARKLYPTLPKGTAADEVLADTIVASPPLG